MKPATRRLVTLPLVAVLGLALAGTAAHASPKGGGPAAAKFTLLQWAQLQLTPDQITRIEALKSKQKEAARSRHEKVRAHREALARLMREEPFNRGEAQKQINGLVEATSVLRRTRLEAMLDLSEILTAEQRRKMQKIRRENRGRRGPGHRGPFASPPGEHQSP